jgi:3-hydroxybutyryl-CoA dehydratase
MSTVEKAQAGGTIFDDWFDDVRMNEVHRTPRYTLSAEEIRIFADLTGDHHPLHLDPDYGAASIFGRNIAHGLLVLSRGMGIVPLNPERTLILRRAETTFKRPVMVDQEFFVDSWIVDKKPIDDKLGLVSMQQKLKVLPIDREAGDEEAKVAVRGVIDGLWARTPAAFGEFDVSRIRV